MTALSLIDIRNVQIDSQRSLEDRARSFLSQIRNPYHFRYGKYEIEISFVGSERLEDKLIAHLTKK